MTKTTEPTLSVIAGAINEFNRDYAKFKEKNVIEKEFISSQIAQMPNPQYVKGITSATQPEFVMGVIISAVIFAKPKKE